MPLLKQSNIRRNMCLGAVPLPLMKNSNIRRITSTGAVAYAPQEKSNIRGNMCLIRTLHTLGLMERALD